MKVKEGNEINTNLTIIVDGNSICFDKFCEVQKQFSIILEEVDKEFFEEKKKSIRWDVYTVSTGSINLTLTGIPIDKKNGVFRVLEVLSAIESGMRVIEQVSERPSNFSDRALKSIETLGNLLGEDITKLQLKFNTSSINLTRQMATNVDELIGARYESFGSVEGILNAINLHRQSYFNIYSALNDKAIKCFFSNNLLEKAKNSLGKRVYAYGLIRSRSDGERVSIKVEELEIFPNENDLPSVKEMAGFLAREDF